MFKKGYTPLDFLCHYRENNQDKMTSYDLELFKELYETMFLNIRSTTKLTFFTKNQNLISNNY